MPFPERLLGEHEDIVYDLRPHWSVLVRPALAAALALAAGTALWLLVPAGSWQAPAQALVSLAVLAVLLGWVAPRLLRWLTTHLVLTTDRVIYRSGLVAKHSREIPLERVDNVTFTQSLWERLVGRGDLIIQSAGENGQSHFANIPHPEEVQHEIYRQMEANGERLRTVQVARATSPLDELERLANLRERGALTDAEFERKKRQLLDRI